MAMSKEQKKEFSALMSQGKKYYIIAQSFESKENYVKAKVEYNKAMALFEKAFMLAKSENDFAQEEANREYRLSKAMSDNLTTIILKQK